MNLNNCNVLITGAAKRIGKEIALTLALKGANVVVHFKSSEKEAEKTVKEIQKFGVKAFKFKANLSNSNEIKKLIDFTVKKLGSIDVLINNASIFKRTLFEKITEKDINENFEVNLKAPFLCSLFAAKHMKKQRKGKIINLIDSLAFNPGKNFLPYTVSKGGLISLTQGLAKELAPIIQVNGIAPGLILMPKFVNKKLERKLINKTLLKKSGLPKDIANVVVFLIEGSDFITGEIIFVDGGSHLQQLF